MFRFKRALIPPISVVLLACFAAYAGATDPWNVIGGSDISPDGQGTRSIALADVDNDGDLDIVAGNNGFQTRLYLNDGSTQPWQGVVGSNISLDAHLTRSMVLGDVDRDGDLDLVVGNWGQTNRLYLNNGTADPWNGVTGSDITGDIYRTPSLALGDVDGDGDLDLIAAGPDGEPNRLYLNNGTADPWNGVAGSDITAENYATWAVALGDVDSDGDLDLVAGNAGQTNRLYLNNGTADPWNGVSGVDITADTGTSRSLALGDVDRDGDLDLVVGSVASETNRLYLNNGTAAPWNGVSGSDVSADVGDTWPVVLADVDADGRLDLVTGNFAQVNRLYLNNGTADPWNSVTGVDLTSETNDTYHLAVGHADGDGILDLVEGNLNGQTNRVYVGCRTLVCENSFTDIGAGLTGVQWGKSAWGDYNNDGNLDVLLTGDSNGGRISRLYQNNGGGSFTELVIAVADVRDSSVDWGDYDNDGDLDILLTGDSSSGNVSRVYRNDGAATFTDISAGLTNVQRGSSAWGDYDNDGRLDILLTGGGNSKVYRNEGSDTFADISAGIAGVGAGSSGDWGDYDNDGDLDVLLCGSSSRISRVYRNDGAAVFTDIGAGLVGVNECSVAWGDYDRDGFLDILLTGSTVSARIGRVYRNDGAGGFADIGAGLTGVTNGSADWGDVDNDGDLDILLTGCAGGLCGNYAARVYRNNGDDIFTDIGAGITGVTNSSVEWGDYDNDGDLDALVTGYNTGSGRTSRIYRNDEVSCAIADDSYNTDEDVPLVVPAGAGVLSNDTGDAATVVTGPSNGVLDLQLDGGFTYTPTMNYYGSDSFEYKLNGHDGLTATVSLTIDPVDDGVPVAVADSYSATEGTTLNVPQLAGVIANDTDPDEDSEATVVFSTVINGTLALALDGSFVYAPDAGFVGSDQFVYFLTDGDGDTSDWQVAVIDVAAVCIAPDETIYLYQLTLDGNSNPVLHFMDPNQPTEVTGYNVYRSSSPTGPWDLEGSDVVDMDLGTPNYQWVDQSGDPGPFYYQVAAYDSACGVEGPW